MSYRSVDVAAVAAEDVEQRGASKDLLLDDKP